MGDGPLPLDIERAAAEIGPRDLLLALLSHQHARTAGGVAAALDKAVAAHLPGTRAALVHWDAGSTDGTPDAVAQAAGGLPRLALAAPAVAPPRRLLPAHGVPGGDLALRAVCGLAQASGARAVLLVGADLRGLPDEWVARLLGPVWAGELDLVTPLFARPALGGPVATVLLCRLARALYGASTRSLVTAELALSGGLAARLGEAPGWGTPASRTPPLFVGTAAAAVGARVGEACLGARDA